MTIKKFIIKNAIKIVAFTIFSIIIFSVLSAIAPVITNNIALGQMSNDDALYIAWESYNRTKQIVNIVYDCIVVVFIGSIGIDTYKLIKTKEKKEE